MMGFISGCRSSCVSHTDHTCTLDASKKSLTFLQSAVMRGRCCHFTADKERGSVPSPPPAFTLSMDGPAAVVSFAAASSAWAHCCTGLSSLPLGQHMSISRTFCLDEGLQGKMVQWEPHAWDTVQTASNRNKKWWAETSSHPCLGPPGPHSWVLPQQLAVLQWKSQDFPQWFTAWI